MRRLNNTHTDATKRGFTLIETSMVLLVVGILIAAAAMPYKLWLENRIQKTTAQNSNRITAALTNHLVQNGHYPCPARLDVDRTHPAYGMPGICDPSDGSYPTATPGTCLNGICFEESERLVDINPDPSISTDIRPIIRRGAVPFRVLGLTEDEAEDGYGLRFQYAITEPLTVPQTYIDTSGGISIVDENDQTRVTPPQSAHYVIFSSGKDKKGAYTRNGRMVYPCGTQEDSENCNTSPTNEKAIYSFARTNTSNNATHFDDHLKFYSSVATPLWQVTDNSAVHIRDLIGVESGGRIGINTNNPTEAVDVGGSIKVDDGGVPSRGRVMGDRLCSGSDPSACFNIEEYGGDSDNFDCNNPVNGGNFAKGFSGGSIDCTDTSQVRCPSGQRVRGINADGTLRCENFRGCPSKNASLCYNPVTGTNDIHYLAPRIRWTQEWTAYSGSGNYRELWYCQGNETWKLKNTEGTCNCTPSDTTDDESCNSFWEGFWNGTIEINTVVSCPSGTITHTETGPNTCSCRPDTQTATDTCPDGFTGTTTLSRDWICDTTTSGHFEPWTEDLSGCTCVPNTEVKDFDCPFAHTGDWQRTRDFECPSGTWTAWTDITNTCVCTGATEYKTEGCAEPLVGNKTFQRDWNCGAGTWGSWSLISNDCGAVTYRWRAKSASSGPFGGALSVEVNDTCTTPGTKTSCSAPAGGGDHWHYTECECE